MLREWILPHTKFKALYSAHIPVVLSEQLSGAGERSEVEGVGGVGGGWGGGQYPVQRLL